MSKKNNNKTKLHKISWVHIAAILILGGYFVLSKMNTLYAMSKDNVIDSFLQLYIFGSVFACIFLYLFSHEKFFPVAKEIEKKEEKKEKKYLKKYLHHGKILATLIVGTLGGPVFSSLTARLLLNNFWYKYLIVVFTNLSSTVITLGLSKSFITLLNF